MISKKVTIKNPTGLHLRPAGLFCKMALEYESKITFHYRDTEGNAKSVLSVLGACIKSGDTIEIVCEGKDEEKALEAMVELVESGIGEQQEKRIRRYRKDEQSYISCYGSWNWKPFRRRNQAAGAGRTKWLNYHGLFDL